MSWIFPPILGILKKSEILYVIQGANGSPRFPSTVSQNSTQARRKPYLPFSLLCNNFFIPLGSAEEVEARQRAQRWIKIFLLVNTTHSQKPCGT